MTQQDQGTPAPSSEPDNVLAAKIAFAQRLSSDHGAAADASTRRGARFAAVGGALGILFGGLFTGVDYGDPETVLWRIVGAVVAGAFLLLGAEVLVSVRRERRLRALDRTIETLVDLDRKSRHAQPERTREP